MMREHVAGQVAVGESVTGRDRVPIEKDATQGGSRQQGHRAPTIPAYALHCLQASY